MLSNHRSTFVTSSQSFISRVACLLILAFYIASLQPVYAQYEAYPPGFSQILVATNLMNPTAITFAQDGRLFIAQQDGKLRVIKDEQLLPDPFVTIPIYSVGEAGLTGVALDPDFANNHYVYVYYTVPGTPYHNRISRFTASGDTAVAGSEQIVLELDNLNYAEQHNGGALAFGKDGKLYVGVGDSRIATNAQDLDLYLGKILRINPDGSIPSGNPFTEGSAAKQRLWGYGLRNPFSLSIQPETGRIFVNDVGESSWEEINDATVAGKNFGWPSAEGNSSNTAFTNPVLAYPHTLARCAITGGTFFSPTTTTYPASFSGKYFFQDFCTSAISYIDLSVSNSTPTVFGQNLPGQPIGLTTGPDGNLYFLSRTNALYKIIYPTNSAPQIVTQPKPSSVPYGRSIRLTVATTGASPMTYQWQKDGIDIVGATSAVYAISTSVYTDAGAYRVLVTNKFGSIDSNQASLSITIPNDLPTATILTPINHRIYKAGDIISFSGIATDPEDGVLPDSAFVWTVEFHHGSHHHDGPPILVGAKSGQFVIPIQGETAPDVYYKLILTVTDSLGGSSADTVVIEPHLVEITIDSNLSGLQVALNGPSVTTPHKHTFVSGLLLSLSAPNSQTILGKNYAFSHWLTGPDNEGNIIVPDSNVSYSVVYKLLPCPLPDSLASSSLTNTSAVLIWHIDGATSNTAFDVRWRPANSSQWTTANNLTTSSGTGLYSLSALDHTTVYEWQLRTHCSSTDSSAFSESTTFRTYGTCQSIKNGLWEDPSVWSCNRVPLITDLVYLNHNLTIPANYTAYARTISYALWATLTWREGAQLKSGR